MGDDQKGFTNMDPQSQKDIASKGEQDSHDQNNAQSDDAEGVLGGQASSDGRGNAQHEEAGEAAKRSGNAHELTKEEQSEGGSKSGGDLEEDPSRANDAGEMGDSE